jgi:Domain of unknown function (DUF932)
MSKLMLHAGGYVATLDEVAAVVTPPANADTGWTPIPHVELMEQTVGALERAGHTVEKQELGLWGEEGQRFFATFALSLKVAEGAARLLLGLRNSHDQSFAAGLAFGQNVFVCDNRAFNAEVTLGRKHTRFIHRDLPGLLTERLALLPAFTQRAEQRIASWQRTEIGTLHTHDLIVRAYDHQVISGGAIRDVLREYRNPRHPEFKPRTLWSLHNAFTEVLKKIQPIDLARRTRSLDVLLDGAAEHPVAPWNPELN